MCCNLCAMAKKRKQQSLGDLLRNVIAARTYTAWCAKAGLRPQTVSRLIDGLTRPGRSTVGALSVALCMDDAAVRAACAASRVQAADAD